jgi:hypothetical protein
MTSADFFVWRYHPAMPILETLKRLLPVAADPDVDRYEVHTVTHPKELAMPERLPAEIRYVLAVQPKRIDAFRGLLERGYGIAVRRTEKTPERLLLAIDRISHHGQRNTVLPWLEDLLRDGVLPGFSAAELEAAERKGISLYGEAKLLMENRYEFRKIVIVDLHNRGVTEGERTLMQEANQDLLPLAMDAIVHRAVFDNAHTRTETARAIIKALVVIGPVAHGLEHLLSGLGKVFAASADDVLAEIAELFALRGSGFTWRQLARRSRILVPVFLAATWLAFQVEPLLRSGRPGSAGIAFGISAVALSLTTAIQSVFLYRAAFRELAAEGKVQPGPRRTLIRLALRQDFLNPARLGLFLGAFASPCVAAAVFVWSPEWISNGWILALLGSTESVVAGLAVASSGRVERWLFKRRVERAIRAI